MDPENTIAGSGSSGPSTVFLPGEDRLPDRRMGAVRPEELVWGSQSLAGLSDAAIMMVDDEPLAIEMTEAFLEGAGYRNFVWTTRSETAVELMRAKRPSLVLLDLSMPKVSGLQILQIMRNEDALCHIPVIVLTSTLDPEVKLQALSMGAMDFLSKPVDPSELALRIRNTLAATIYRDYLAQHDPLTGLPNKLCYREAVRAACSRPDRENKGALIHIGVDQLGRVNDAMGRDVGDQLVQRIGKRLSSCVQAESAAALGSVEDHPTLYRFDGDEFAVLLPLMEDIETAAALISRLLDAGSTSFDRGGAKEIFVTCSIGVAVFPDDGAELDTLVTNAGLAMRHAKRSGRQNYAFFSSELNEKAVRMLSRGADLRMAYTHDQMQLLYQPRVDTATRTLAGAQAIPRWTHHSGEVFQGDGVLELATTSEMSMALTEWMLRQLRDQTVAWRTAEIRPLRVGVPFDLDHLTLRQLGEMLRTAIRGGLPPQCVAIEFRGGAHVKPEEDDIAILASLKRIGVHFVLDDFGGPDSSLLELRWLPVDEVKIHRLFFQPGGAGRDGAALATSLLAMVRQLGLLAIATGIETERQLDVIEAQQCDEYQGPLIGPPMTADAFAKKWLPA